MKMLKRCLASLLQLSNLNLEHLTFLQIANKNSQISKDNTFIPDRDQGSQVSNPAMFYPMLWAHLLKHDLNTWKYSQQSRGSSFSNQTLTIFSNIQRENTIFKTTNQSLEVIHKSSRFTTPSSKSFFRAEPIY